MHSTAVIGAGDGYSKCSPSTQIEQLGSAYYTLGASQLACPEGTDVPYPTTAPGYVHDPTGWTSSQVCFQPSHTFPLLKATTSARELFLLQREKLCLPK